MSLSKDNKFCVQHKRQRITMICMDQECPSKPLICTLCYKEKHLYCDNDLLVIISDIKEQVMIVNLTTNKDQFRNITNAIVILRAGTSMRSPRMKPFW